MKSSKIGNAPSPSYLIVRGPARSAVQAERSEFIVSLDGASTGRIRPWGRRRSKGRLNTMTDNWASSTLISGVTCGVANEVQAIAGNLFNETRSYNSLFQLAQITVSGALNIQYAYSATMNNGKITSQTDVISGEQVVYTYDALNRPATAQTMQTGGTQWGQSYNYDGFGNLTDQNVIKGSAPSMHVTYNASTNRQTGDTADANGNLGSGYIYDISNRLIQASGTTMKYAYAADNK